MGSGINRTYDANALLGVMAEMPPDKRLVIDAPKWMEVPENIALEYEGSIGLFTYELPGVYAGHYLFRARGKEALKVAKAMLEEVITKYDAKVIIGLVPASNKPSAWITRQLGFKHHGMLADSVYGPLHLFIYSDKPAS